MSEEVLFTKRRVRIQCPPDRSPVGIGVSITDAETGELIAKVTRVVITLDAEDVNKAEITYYETDEYGKPIVKDDESVKHTVESIDPIVDITAFEVKHD